MNKETVLQTLDFNAFYREYMPSLTGGPQAAAHCPFPEHEDRRASFSVNLDTGLYNCHGCGRKGDVFTFYQDLKGVDFKKALKEIAESVRLTESKGERRLIKTYDYCEEKGDLLYQVCRFEPKDFRPRRQGPDGKWMYNLEGVRRVPYNLPQLLNAQNVIIVEGEKDAENLKAILSSIDDIAVTTIHGGAKAWKKEYADFFKDKRVAIIPDHDRPGLEYAETVARSLHGTASLVKIVELPGLGDIKEKHGLDVSDWIELCRKDGKTDGEIKEELTELIKTAPEWVPSSTINSTTAKGEIHPIPLPDELSPVEPFDFALLPETLRPWAEDISERIQCPPDFVAAGIMTSLAAVLGRKVAVRPQEHTDWTVIPNIWAIVVGRPGVMKSPALEAVLAPLKRLAADATESYATAIEEFNTTQVAAKLRRENAEKKARKMLLEDPDADLLTVLAVDEVAFPVQKRYMANDSTPEALGELLRQNPNGLLVYRDEIVSLLKGLDREDRAEGRGFYLTAWNGDASFTFDRIGRGLNLHIDAVCLSLLGGTQPGRLSEYIGHAVRGGTGDDGLIQRFGLLAWPDTVGKWKDVDRWPDNDAKNRAYKVFEHLCNIDPISIGARQDTDINGNPDGPPYLRLSPSALELFQEWRTDLETRLRSGDLHQALESHYAKYRKLIPALALIIHLADNESGPVTENAMLKALAWGEYLETHAKRAYGAISQPEVTTAKAIISRIKKGDLATSFSSRDVWRHGWSKLSDSKHVARALQLLVDYDWLTVEYLETSGRPKTVYHVNEGVME